MEEDDDPYLQIDLGKQNVITAVATQGLNNPQGNWVERYSLNYSCDGINWKTYQSFAKDEVNTIPLNTFTSYELKVRLNRLNLGPIHFPRDACICHAFGWVCFYRQETALLAAHSVPSDVKIGNRNKWG